MTPKIPVSVAMVILENDKGDWSAIHVNDGAHDTFNLYKSIDNIPCYIDERIALLKLCDADAQTIVGEHLGRRVHKDAFHVYLSYEELRELRSIAQQRKLTKERR